MKLIHQVVLLHVEGRSEKVYEVDLLEVGEDRFVVNFRYGKRGSTLRDGSKTVSAVARAEADRVFAKLVDSKLEQGYEYERDVKGKPTADVAQVHAARGGGDRARIIVERLNQVGTERRWFRREGQNNGWLLERAIWRAGELRLREAEPALLALLNTATSGDVAGGGQGIRNYSVAFALGRLGSEAAMEPLAKLRADSTQPGHVQRIATEALLQLSDAATRAELARDVVRTLPAPLRVAHASGSADAFAAALAAFLPSEPNAFATLELLYLIDDPIVRPALLAELARAPFDSPTFFWLRHLFKAAEYRRDPRAFGLFAARFEKVRANRSEWNKKVPYGSATREYLRRRTWRTLRRVGQLADPDYVPMAVGVLLAFSDADAVSPRHPYGPFAPYRIFNQILFANSPRWELLRNTKAFRLKRGQRLDAPVPPTREEAFPALWEARPEGLMQLLAESECTPVHEFAAKALRACPQFLAALDDDDVALLLERTYLPTAKLGFELAGARPHTPRLLLALASCTYEPARRQGLAWIDEARSTLQADSAFLAALVTAPHADARAFARTWVRSLVLAPAAGAVLVGRVLAFLIALPDDEPSAAIALDVAQTVGTALGKHLESVGPAALRDLLAHPLAGVQEVGAELLSRLDSRSGLIPIDVVLAVLRSPFANVRAVGLRLLGEMHDDALTLNFRLLVHLTADANADLRSASRGLVQRVATAHPEIGLAIAEGLVDALVRRKLAEGVPSHVLRVLKEELGPIVRELSRERVWRLLRSGSPHAQELGGILLVQVPASELEVAEIVELGSHDVLAVREAAWHMFEQDRARIQTELAVAAKLCDATWQDTRTFAAGYFRALPPECFTADVLVSIIDSVKEDVQAFGRELSTRVFKDEDGPALLLKLAEHPARSVQLFASNYLERFAEGRIERLVALVPYFTSVLSRVNQGRVAKARVLAFLRHEGEASAAAAEIVVALLHRLSATIAIDDKALAIEAMLAIARAHPELPTPLTVVAPPLWTAPAVDSSRSESR